MLDAGGQGQFQSVVTDPPYGLGFASEKWDAETTIAFQAETWELASRLLKPGGHLVAFGGGRTYHRLACAIEDAGFTIRDQLIWVYGTAMPHSTDMSKSIDKLLGAKREVVGTQRIANDIRGGRLVKAGRKLPAFERDVTVAATDQARRWEGWGTALKPCHEPIVLACKQRSEKTLTANVLRHGTGALNLGACRVANDGEASRWGTNLAHDGSAALDDVLPRKARRYFYSAKASAEDRAGSLHPTVKPLALMRWLVRLVTPPGGHVFDPFAGSGSTIEAALLEGFHTTGCELTAEYWDDIERRLQRGQGMSMAA